MCPDATLAEVELAQGDRALCAEAAGAAVRREEPASDTGQRGLASCRFVHVPLVSGGRATAAESPAFAGNP